MGPEEQAKEYFTSGFNCAESVLLALSKRLLSGDGAGAFIPMMATGFGGGMALNGDTCGALSGGIIAIDLVLGRNQPLQSRDTCYSAVDRLYQDFKKKFGTCKCCELTGVDLKTAEGLNALHDRIRGERCKPIVEWTAKRTSQIIQELVGNI
ncbi:MAG: C-GCAxxG-C-C family protein [Candidatus Bathyarchaeia archaeon]